MESGDSVDFLPDLVYWSFLYNIILCQSLVTVTEIPISAIISQNCRNWFLGFPTGILLTS